MSVAGDNFTQLISLNQKGECMLKVLNIKVKVEFNPSINVEPSTEVSPDDTVLGKVSLYQKELFIAALQLRIAADNSFEASNGSDANGMKKILKAKANELSKKSDDIMRSFVTDVMGYHNLWEKCNEIDIGVRKDWMVVWTEVEEEETAPYVIEALDN